MKKPMLALLTTVTITLLSGCGQNISAETTDELENGISAIEDAMSEGKTADSSQQTETDAIAVMGFSAAGMIYSFYGRLSVGNMDSDWLSEGNLPPTYYVYGTEDPFYDQFERQYDVISSMGIETGRIVLNGWPHGFGSDGGWVSDYADWLVERCF